ncbi:MAG: site-2 protease family protein [Cytophagales bacterium]|nr:MAG: site-2 protease family protein [Cytophagales bacterium]
MATFRKYTLHIVLFIITFTTTTLAGSEWIHGRGFLMNDTNIGWSEWMTWEKFLKGLAFSVPFLGFLTVHEFGHYFAARLYKARVTLPFYIPMWLGLSFSIGTMGAFIQIRSQLKSRKEFFDIGIAGPLAGFVVALLVLVYGLLTLPPPEYIFQIHPEWEKYGLDYAKYVYTETENDLALGKNLLFWVLESLLADPKAMPNSHEIIHYPWLFAGYLGLLFTALNLIPIGQLDGGHILYALIGNRNHRIVSPLLLACFVTYAGLGSVSPYWSNEDLLIYVPLYLFFLYMLFSRVSENRSLVLSYALTVFTVQFVINFFYPTWEGYSGWFVFAFVLGRFLGVYHPDAPDNTPLNMQRKILGWLSLIIFILCFSPKPFMMN